MWTLRSESKCGDCCLFNFFFLSYQLHLCTGCAPAFCLKMLLNYTLLLQTFCAIKWPDCLTLTHKLKAFSAQLTTPTVTLRVLLRCFFERFSSLSRCHDNSTDECMPRILVVLQQQWSKLFYYLLLLWFMSKSHHSLSWPQFFRLNWHTRRHIFCKCAVTRTTEFKVWHCQPQAGEKKKKWVIWHLRHYSNDWPQTAFVCGIKRHKVGTLVTSSAKT